MKKKRVFLIVILVVLILPLIGYAGWMIKKGTQLEVFVVNKSMTGFRGSENRALNYVLNKEKILTAGNRLYNLKFDHYGLIWNKGNHRIKLPRLNEVERMAEKVDLIYYADVSGVSSNQAERSATDDANKPVQGGLNNTDYTLLREVISRGKPVIAEFCFFSPPTEPLVRFNIEKLTDVYFVGWIGKYVKNLSLEADTHLGFDWKELYTEYTGNDWTAKGPGMVMVNPESRRVLVLLEGEDIQCKKGFLFSSNKAIDKYNLLSRVKYHGWFSILHAGRNEVLSEFQLNATEKGKVALNEFGIPETFPALIHADDHLYFMAGDFGKSRSDAVFARMVFLGPLVTGIRSRSKGASSFFYSYFKPIMTSILHDAIEIKESGERDEG